MVKSVRIVVGLRGRPGWLDAQGRRCTLPVNINMGPLKMLELPDGWTGTLLAIPDGEKLEGAVGRYLAHARKWMDGGSAACLRYGGKCPTCSKELLSGCRECEVLLPAAEAELAGQQIITLEALEYLYKSGPPPTPVYAEGPCRVAIRRLEPEGKVTFWRRPGAWLENSVCASCGDTFRFSTSARKCPRCGAEGEPRDLPGQGECST